MKTMRFVIHPFITKVKSTDDNHNSEPRNQCQCCDQSNIFNKGTRSLAQRNIPHHHHRRRFLYSITSNQLLFRGSSFMKLLLVHKVSLKHCH